MKPLFQLSTRSYDEEIIIVRKAMEELETKCNVKNGFLLKEPSGMAGWTFFNLELSDADAFRDRDIWNDDKCTGLWV